MPSTAEETVIADVALRVERTSWRPVITVAGGLALLGLALHLLDPSRAAAAQNFRLVFSSLLIEAFPFILLGALVSAAIEVFVPSSVFEKLTLLPRPLQLPAAGLAGFAFPVCECGSV
ncbi:MAG: permease, partial [Actinomycetota bacterium]